MKIAISHQKLLICHSKVNAEKTMTTEIAKLLINLVQFSFTIFLQVMVILTLVRICIESCLNTVEQFMKMWVLVSVSLTALFYQYFDKHYYGRGKHMKFSASCYCAHECHHSWRLSALETKIMSIHLAQNDRNFKRGFINWNVSLYTHTLLYITCSLLITTSLSLFFSLHYSTRRKKIHFHFVPIVCCWSHCYTYYSCWPISSLNLHFHFGSIIQRIAHCF